MINIEEFKNKLLKEREEILLLLENLNIEKKELKEEPVGETSDYANIYEVREEIHLQEEFLKNRLELVNKALKKIEENKYGICENCGKEIEEIRLNIDPATSYCRTCANKLLT